MLICRPFVLSLCLWNFWPQKNTGHSLISSSTRELHEILRCVNSCYWGWSPGADRRWAVGCREHFIESASASKSGMESGSSPGWRRQGLRTKGINIISAGLPSCGFPSGSVTLAASWHFLLAQTWNCTDSPLYKFRRTFQDSWLAIAEQWMNTLPSSSPII